MSLRFLLDTNVVSEPLRPAPDPGIVRRLNRHQGEVGISSVAWHELLFGWERMPPSRKKDAVQKYLYHVVRLTLAVLPYDDAAAGWHARERVRLATAGRTPPFLDAQIAATAYSHGLTLVTKNRADFEGFEGIRVEDWSTATSPPGDG